MEEILPFCFKIFSLPLFEAHNYNMLYVFPFFLAANFPMCFVLRDVWESHIFLARRAS